MSESVQIESEPVTFECVCGESVTVSVGELGGTLFCEHCERYLRPSLGLFLMKQEEAPNLTLVCPQGHLVMSESKRPGRIVTCRECRLHLVTPRSQTRPARDEPMRIPSGALRRTVHAEKAPTPAAAPKRRPRVMESFGGRVCVNPMCKAQMPHGANVCAMCGTNALTARAYLGNDPAKDPFKRFWPGPLNW
jgi:hypothetical protein